MAAAHVLDYVLYAVLMALGVAQGIYVSCRKRRGHDVSREAFLGDRSLGVLPLACVRAGLHRLAARTGGPDGALLRLRSAPRLERADHRGGGAARRVLRRARLLPARRHLRLRGKRCQGLPAPIGAHARSVEVFM
ncbi:hypothetical protein MTO96_012815 [Rhipicephalus appendiculatus]